MATAPHMSPLPFLAKRSPSARHEVQECSSSFTQTQSPNFFARLKARKSSGTHSNITPAEAVWFLSLPEKVRRQHFTKEEQILMRARSELALLDTAPTVLSHAEEFSSKSPKPGKPQSCRHDSTTSSTNVPLLPVSGFASYPGSPIPSVDMDTPRLVDEGFDENPFMHRSSFFSSPSFRQSTWSRSTRSTQSSPLIDEHSHFSSSPSRTRAQPPPALPLNRTFYIKDPNAKELLRDCLDSSRFEEALTFGFPTSGASRLADSDVVSPGTKVHSNWLASPADEDDHELSDDWRDASSVDERELCTPTSPEHPQFFSRQPDTYEEEDCDYEAAEAPTVPRNASNTSYFEDLMRRDMTLRMTLTKPELRAPDEELYGWQQGYEEVPPPSLILQKDPLALEDLTFSDDTTGLNGVFAQSMSKKKGIRGLWFRK